MTEKEKRDAGLLYDANYDEALQKELIASHDRCYEYNLVRPSDLQTRRTLLKQMLGSTGEHFTITQPFRCDYGYNIHLGENFYSNYGLVILDCAKVTFGDNVFVAPNCGFYTAGHPIDAVRRNQGLEYAYPITVGDNVWFGAGVHVMPGVKIGSNVVIGAGSVVTKDIPDDVVAIGNPCRVLRPITEEDLTRDYDWK
ncbi:MAG: sugar O-acetyltransferase [Oscillospiraceae bacterium]|nr:sugar O-acetyltransferase [Oscillospiraceae bacterium]